MYVNTTGIVLRETAYKDSSKILTVLTDKEGKLTVSARGALRRNSKLAAATQLLVFSEMTLLSSRDRWTLTEARSIEQFRGLQDDITKLALGSYFAELTEAVADEDNPNSDLMPLCLNTLYALSEGIRPVSIIKPAFELRLMMVSGFSPLVTHCSICGKEEPEHVRLDTEGGTIHCDDCYPGAGIALSPGALKAVRYIIGCDLKKLFYFSLGEVSLREMSNAAEEYLITHLDRKFRTLEFYKQLGVRG